VRSKCVGAVKRTGEILWKGEVTLYFKILEKPMTWTELKRETGFSNTTLAAYLNHLTNLRYIQHDFEARTYRTSAYFLKFFPEKMAEAYRLVGELAQVGEIVEAGGIGEAVFKVNEATVRAHASLLAAYMPAMLYAALGGKGPYKIGPQESKDSRRLNTLERKILSDSHALLDELLENWLRPWAHQILSILHILSSTNKDILTDVGGPMLEAALREVNRYDQLTKPLLATLKKS